MKKTLLLFSVLLFVISSFPLFMMGREVFVSNKFIKDYTINDADMYRSYTTERVILGQSIQLIETPTGKKAARTHFDEIDGVEAGEIIHLQLVLNGKKSGEPIEIALSNRDYNPRYFNWVDIFTVKENETGEQQLAIVQRTSNDEAVMPDRSWRVTMVDEEGQINELNFTYADRSNHLFATHLVQRSSTTLMSIGYYTDMMHYYPTIFYPILYPFGSVLVAVVFLFASATIHYVQLFKKRKVAN